MSRAFTREIDDAPTPPIAERPISKAPNLVTAHGAHMIEDKLTVLKKKLRAKDPALVKAIGREQRYWEARRATMQIVTPLRPPQAVAFGVTALIDRNGRRMAIQIVGEDEAEPSRGKVAWTSPLARALEGASAGDRVEFQTATISEVIEIVGLS